MAYDAIEDEPTYRIWTKADSTFSLAVRDGDVILATEDSSDEAQHWVKDEKYKSTVRDENGKPSFALINKETCQALKHSVDASYPLRLQPYDPDVMDYSTLWTCGEDNDGSGFTAIRMVNNIHLNMDALHGIAEDDGISDGTTVVLWEFNGGPNQYWRIEPY